MMNTKTLVKCTSLALAMAATSANGAVLLGLTAPEGNGNFDTLDPSNATATNPTRRGQNGGSHFMYNWTSTQTAFGGFDQVSGSGDTGALANDGVTTTVTAFSTPSPDALTGPSGQFTVPISIGESINYGFEVIDNANGGSFDYTISLVNINGGAGTFEVVTGTFTADAGNFGTYVPISGTSAPITSAITSYNVEIILNNGNGLGGVDQVGLDDVTLESVPEPSSSLLSLAALGAFAFRRKRT